MEVGAGKCSRPIGGSNWISILNLPAFRPDGPITRYVKIISPVLTQKLVLRGKRTTSPQKSILPASLSLVFPKPPKANHFQLSLQILCGKRLAPCGLYDTIFTAKETCKITPSEAMLDHKILRMEDSPFLYPQYISLILNFSSLHTLFQYLTFPSCSQSFP